MKFKKIFISMFISLILLFQTTMAMADNIITYNSKNVSDQHINQQYTTLANTEINNMFTDVAKEKIKSFKLLVVNQEIYKLISNDKENWDSGVKGLFLARDREILLYQDMYRYNGSRCFYHEIGHLLDYDLIKDDGQVGLYSDTIEFKTVMAAEKEILSKYTAEYYFSTNIHEQFAECFGFYATCPDQMKSVAPKTYAYMEKLNFIKR